MFASAEALRYRSFSSVLHRNATRPFLSDLRGLQMLSVMMTVSSLNRQTNQLIFITRRPRGFKIFARRPRYK